MEIRKAKKEDIKEMMEMVEHSREKMRESGNMTQWTNGYPGKKDIEDDIETGRSHVIEEGGRKVGMFTLAIGIEPTYSVIEGGAWLDDEREYGTIHRLASLKGTHGVGQACIDWCGRQIGNLRADTHADNKTMQHILEKNGFKYCGIVWMEDGTPRRAYQRVEERR